MPSRFFFPFLSLLALVRLAGADIYVSPLGSDQNSGTFEAPYQTLDRALQAISAPQFHASPGEKTTVWLRGGIYPLASSVMFGRNISGTATNPIAVSSFPGETARLSGSISLAPAWFTLATPKTPRWAELPASAQGHVLTMNLFSHGITELGRYRARDYKTSAATPAELFCEGTPMTRARWPNANDNPPFLSAQRVTDQSGSISTNTMKCAVLSRQIRGEIAGARLHGFLVYPWADDDLSITKIDAATNTLELSPSPRLSLANNLDYNPLLYIYNLIDQLDQPGEYYIDTTTGILYFWPPSPLDKSVIQLSALQSPLLKLDGPRHLRFRNLTIECGRSHLIAITDGDDIVFENCCLRNAGQSGAVIEGTDNGLDHCEISNCGEEGAVVGGGDRLLLIRANNFITHCHIHDGSRIGWTYHPGVLLTGCGNTIAHNLFDHLPHQAIMIQGNEHIIDGNEISFVCLITSDSGAIYSGADWSFRGNCIKNNYIHHISTIQADGGVNGVYLDDCASGFEITGNVFYRIQNVAIALGGGRDNHVTNNLIAHARVAISDDDRGRLLITGATGKIDVLTQLKNLHYRSAPWATKYPECAAIPDSWAELLRGRWRNPENCVFEHNAGFANTEWMREQHKTSEPEPLGGVFSSYRSTSDNNSDDHSWEFSDEISLDRTQRPQTLHEAVPGFTPIRFGAIGPSP